MEKINHPDWLNKDPWYNTSICSRLHGRLFENFITHARTDRYNIMCSVVSHDKIQPAFEDYERSIGDRLITKHGTTESLKKLVATFNFIGIWLKLLEDNYDAIRVACSTAMTDMFKQIPTTMTKPLSKRKKVQKIMTEICGGWYMEKITKVITPLKRPKLIKKAQDKED